MACREATKSNEVKNVVISSNLKDKEAIKENELEKTIGRK